MAVGVADAPHTTYTWTIGKIRAIKNPLDLIDPTKTPLVDRLGLSGANSWDGLDGGKKNTTIEWQEDAMAAIASTLNGSITSDATTITLTDASLVKPGEVLLIGTEAAGEYVHVTSKSGEVATVTRNYGGTQASHDDTTTVAIKGMARLENATGDFDVMTTPEQPYNYTGILQAGVNISGSDLEQSYHGIDDMNAYQGDKAMKRWATKLELNVFYGIRKTGSATTPRGMGGLKTFITSDTAGYVDVGSALVEISDFDNAMEGLSAVGGYPTLAVMHPSRYADIHRALNDYVYVAESQTSDDMVGHKRVKGIRTAFGDLEILTALNCPQTDIFLLDESRVDLYEFRAVFQKNLAITGDGYPSELVGEYSLAVSQGLKAHGWLANVTS